MDNILLCKHAFVILSERVNREHEFQNKISIGNDLCLIIKSMIERGQLFFVQTIFLQFFWIKILIL